LREKRYGLSNYDWNRLLELAVAFSDPERADYALDHITAMDSNVWSSQEIYGAAMSWTVTNHPKPIQEMSH